MKRSRISHGRLLKDWKTLGVREWREQEAGVWKLTVDSTPCRSRKGVQYQYPAVTFLKIGQVYVKGEISLMLASLENHVTPQDRENE